MRRLSCPLFQSNVFSSKHHSQARYRITCSIHRIIETSVLFISTYPHRIRQAVTSLSCQTCQMHRLGGSHRCTQYWPNKSTASDVALDHSRHSIFVSRLLHPFEQRGRPRVLHKAVTGERLCASRAVSCTLRGKGHRGSLPRVSQYISSVKDAS